MNMEDFFDNAPDIVINKILEKLPIRNAAQTSVLSKQWRRAWLSLKDLVFFPDFYEKLKNKDGSYYDWEKCSRIISEILFHHVGHVHRFFLTIPDDDLIKDCLNPSPWISFLSKNGVREIVIFDLRSNNKMDMTSYIYSCDKIQFIQLLGFASLNINPPPVDFSGFPNLNHLQLTGVHFTKTDTFPRLIENCKMLAKLELMHCSGMDHVVIDAPSLKTLILLGYFESLAFRNIGSLNHISIKLSRMLKNYASPETIDAVKLLATSCRLQSIEFNGFLCEFLAPGGIIGSQSVTFNHLHSLCLGDLNLKELIAFHYLMLMIKSCPYIQKLDISFVGHNILNLSDNQSINYNCKLDRLREVKIKDMTGSSAELKLVEYLLSASPVLENLSFQSRKCDTESELKMSRMLMRFPRASPKASIVCLEE